jgi:DUF971 family protein
MSAYQIPTELILHRSSHTLELVYTNHPGFYLPWEYLRVFSPSKEVRARHGKDRILVTGKEQVKLERIEPVGNYAVKLYFDDGHNSGLFDWRYLWELGEKQQVNWSEHLQRLKKEAP